MQLVLWNVKLEILRKNAPATSLLSSAIWNSEINQNCPSMAAQNAGQQLPVSCDWRCRYCAQETLVYIYCAQEASIYLYCAHTSIYLYCVQETSICTFIMSYCHETLTYSLSYGAMGWVPQWGGDIVICWGSVVAWYYRVIWLSPLPPPHSKQYQYSGHHDLAGDGNTPTASCDSNEGFALCKHGIWFYDLTRIHKLWGLSAQILGKGHFFSLSFLDYNDQAGKCKKLFFS